MKAANKILVLLVVCLFVLSVFSVAGYADTIKASSASHADVSAAVKAATYGDTVSVPSGIATWAGTVTLSKCITVEGAGIDQTIIEGNTTQLFYINHDSTSLASDCAFRITGFTMDGNDVSQSIGVTVRNTTITSTPPKNIRIDNNKFTNFARAAVHFSSSGQAYGLIDNNTFIDNMKVLNAYGRYTYSWQREPTAQASLGTDNNIYLESNTISYTPSLPYTPAGISSGHGGRWVARFNTLTYDNTAKYMMGFDVHGNNGVDLDNTEATCPGGTFTYCATGTDACCTAGNRAAMVVESYNNVYNLNDTDLNMKTVDIRGGTVMNFNDTTIESLGTYHGTVFIREEDGQDGLCSGSSKSPTDYESCFDPVRDTYIFNNKNTYDNSEFGVSEYTYGQELYVEADVNYWKYKASFDGSSGVGVGTLEKIPPTCTTGVGYWATDQGTWNTTGEDGVLYRCSATDTWERYYEPYIYPHPLRSTDDIAPDAPMQLKVGGMQ